MTLADPRTHNDAFVALLVDADLTVGDGEAPPDPFGWQGVAGQSQFIPYAIVHPLVQGFDGGLGCPEVDSDMSWQVTCVGSNRAQCDWVRDAVNNAVIGQQLEVDGRFVPRIRPDGGAGTRRDDTTQPPLFIATPRYAALTVLGV